MALLEDVLENSLPGVVIGAVAATVLFPLLGGRRAAAGTVGATAAGGGIARPLVKAAVRGYLAVADTVKEVTAEAREQMSDLVAEVREERKTAAEEADGATTTPGPATA